MFAEDPKNLIALLIVIVLVALFLLVLRLWDLRKRICPSCGRTYRGSRHSVGGFYALAKTGKWDFSVCSYECYAREMEARMGYLCGKAGQEQLMKTDLWMGS